MKVDLYYYEQKLVKGEMGEHYIDHALHPTPIGYIEVENFDPEEIFGLCNWGHWMTEKPKNLHSKINSCGHGLLIINPETEMRYIATSHGWLSGDEKSITEYVLENRYRCFWR